MVRLTHFSVASSSSAALIPTYTRSSISFFFSCPLLKEHLLILFFGSSLNMVFGMMSSYLHLEKDNNNLKIKKIAWEKYIVLQ